MEKSRLKESRVFAVRQEAESGVPAAVLYLKQSMGEPTLYAWRGKYSGMNASVMSQMEEGMILKTRRLNARNTDGNVHYTPVPGARKPQD